ncbi:hypothetical protein [Kaarinaea lacus]
MSEAISNKSVVTFTYQILDEGGNIMEHSDVPMEYIHGASGTMYPMTLSWVVMYPRIRVLCNCRY